MRLWAERLWTGKGGYETFDHIIFACHADDALRILNVGCEATHEEREVLSAFRWDRGDVWVNSDENVGVHFPHFSRKQLVANA